VSDNRIDRIIESIQGLPPLPEAVCRLCELAGDLDADIHEMARVIAEDQALTTRILRIANSAFYGLSGRVRTVSHAIVVLGFREIRNLALGVTVFALRYGRDRSSPLDHTDFWRHALAVASAARMIATHVGLADPEEAYVAGLIHDVGKLVLVEHFPDEYTEALWQANSDGCPLNEAERAILGTDHAEVGRKLCEQWKLPGALVHGVALHHRSLEDMAKPAENEYLASVVRLADNAARVAGVGRGGNTHMDAEPFNVPGVRVTVDAGREILSMLSDKVRDAEALLQMAGTPGEPVEEAAG